MSPSPRPQSVVVIGAGLVGLCTAYWLQRAGLHVTVVDARRAGAGASHGNAGWIVPSLSAPLAAPGIAAAALRTLRTPDAPFRLSPRAGPTVLGWLLGFWRASGAATHAAGFRAVASLAQTTFALFDELVADSVQFEMHRKGLLFCFLTAARAEAELEHLRINADYGYDVPDQVLDGAGLRALEPSLSDQVAGGFLLAEERHIQPATLVTGLTHTLRARGADIIDQAAVTAFETGTRCIRGVHTSKGTLSADAVVMAAGAWSVTLSRQLNIRLPMQPAKGYSMTAALSTPPRQPLYLGEAKAGVSPFSGSVRLAGTFELSGLNERIDQRRITAVANSAQRYLAAPLDRSTLSEAWSGVRPMPVDGLPIIGRAPGYDDLFIATGHGMLGVTLAPATGQALAATIAEGHAPAVLRPFDPARFNGARTRT